MDNDDPPPQPPQVNLPGPSDEERALWQKQAAAADLSMEMARTRSAQEKALMPVLLKQAGLTMTPNSDGTYSVTEAPKSAGDLESEKIRSLANQRVIAGLEGKIPIDPSVEADLARSEAQIDEELARRGITKGSGDIYTRAKNEFLRGANALRYSIRRGEIDSSDAIAQNRQLELMRKQGQALDTIRTGRAGSNEGASLLHAGSSLYGDASRPYTADRYTRYQGDVGQASQIRQNNYNWQLMNQQANADLLGGGIGAAAGIGSAFLLSGLACWIAEVLYGPTSPKTKLLRLWINTAWTLSRSGRLGLRLYLWLGRPIAAVLHRVPVLQRPVRWVFDRLTARAVRAFA